MSLSNRVVWSEGLFLRPQHFQQHTRYVEALVERRAGVLAPYSWGFSDLEIDGELLSLGKLGLRRARGVMPDGTPVDVPEHDEIPAPLDLAEGTRGAVIRLALPVRREGQAEETGESSDDPLARYRCHEFDVADTTVDGGPSTRLRVGRLRLRLITDDDDASAFSALTVARIADVHADRRVVLDKSFIPTSLHCAAAPRLTVFITELAGLLHHRAHALAGRLTGSSQGVAEVADFMLLQLVNRAHPYVRHLSGVQHLHPERLYAELVGIAGELASFTARDRMPPEFPAYRHEDLNATFSPVMDSLRRSLSMVLEQNATALALQERKYGIRVASLPDPSLLGTGVFVLAVKARVPEQQLRSQFPTQVKIGPVERIRQLVNLQLPGIRLRALPVVPRQLPYHAGFTYFELDRAGELWDSLSRSGGFAFHIAGDFPGLELEFWVIREGRG